jgi:phosphoribosyl-ATP pyrophosphohydrolase/phosphoribosyl-AMP cyclohydrolase
VKFDDKGLVVAIAQDRLSGKVQMVAWMNQAALQQTLKTGLATFFSRSRGRLWQKGETSGNVLRVREVCVDCDGDTLLLLCDPTGPSCHTGRDTCFFRSLTGDGVAHDSDYEAVPFVEQLETVLAERASSLAEKSYTKSLLDAGADKIGAKLREEASELAVAVQGETNERVASEAADVIYHLLVALRLRGVSWREVTEVLDRRSGTSGHVEKAGRKHGSAD